VCALFLSLPQYCSTAQVLDCSELHQPAAAGPVFRRESILNDVSGMFPAPRLLLRVPRVYGAALKGLLGEEHERPAPSSDKHRLCQ
jgi:hypothetical protein